MNSKLILYVLVFHFPLIFAESQIPLPHIAVQEGWETLLQIENHSYSEETVNVEVFDGAKTSLTWNGQLTALASETLQLTEGSCGMIRVSSENVAVKVIYHHTFQKGVAEFLLQPLIQNAGPLDLLFPHYVRDSMSWQGYALMNPGEADGTWLATAFDFEGNTLGTSTISIPAHSRIKGFLSNLFPHDGITRVRLVGETQLSGLTLSGNGNAQLLFSKAVMPSVDMRDLPIPHIADDRQVWSNFLVFDNAAEEMATPELQLFRGDDLVYQETLEIPGLTSLVIDLNDEAFLESQTGLLLDLAEGLHVRSGFLVNHTGATAEFYLEPHVSKDEILSFPSYANADLTWNGIALFNPGSEPADIIIKGMREGNEVIRKGILLNPHERMVDRLANLFPEVDNSFDQMVVISNQELTGIQISGADQDRLLFTPASSLSDSRTFLQKLESLPGVAFTESELLEPFEASYRVYVTQPLNQLEPDGRTFVQECFLNHRDEHAPMVLYTGGYMLTRNRYHEMSGILTANQIHLPHRFFDGAKVENPDWQYLNIRQAAEDFHRIVLLFKELYRDTWVNTGGSKGGMTSIFHRRFYPDDFRATVAYVAPIILGLPDDRFQTFVDHQAGTAECRDALRAHQRVMLSLRDSLLPIMQTYASANERTYVRTGLERAFEYAVMEYPVAFWQYGGNTCESIPAPDATPEEMMLHLLQTVGFIYCDQDLDGFEPFYFQAVTEFGYYSFMTETFQDLLQVVPNPSWAEFAPQDVPTQYDQAVMQDIVQWIQAEGNQIVYLYGGNDPWTSCQVELTGQTDALKLVEPGRNHGVRIYQLTEREQVYQKLEQWLDMQVIRNKQKGTDWLEPTLVRFGLGAH